MKIDPAIYDAYTGQYEGGFGVVTITREGDKLFAQPTGQSKEELIPQSETRFTVASVGATWRARASTAWTAADAPTIPPLLRISSARTEAGRPGADQRPTLRSAGRIAVLPAIS